MSLASATNRIRALDPRLVDGLIALLLGCLVELQFLIGEQPGAEADALNLISGLVLAATLIWRRRAPLAMIAVFTITVTLNEALGGSLFSFPEAGEAHSAVPPFGSLLTGAVAFYSLGAHTEERAGRIGLALGLAGFWVTVPISGQADFGSFFFSGALAITPWLIGRNLRARNLRLAAAEREQEQRTRLALGVERARIARELHDIVAHSVGVIVIQAEGARRIFDRNPEGAREALGTIEQTARTALGDMRRSIGVLRQEDGAAAALGPQPGIDDLGELLEQARSGGLEVELVVEGERRDVPQGVDLSAYRIVQEALTNTLKHAGPARSRVALGYGARELRIEVSDDGRGPSVSREGEASGHGLLGMHERVESHGGKLETGPGPDGGFLIRAWLPIPR
jgi:signal transduction histidine kinase